MQTGAGASERYDPRQRLIVALDLPTVAAAKTMVAALGESILLYKVGLQLYTSAGPDAVKYLTSSGSGVFLDLKYHDIPTTVGLAAKEATRLGVRMFTVHASGGEAMLRAAVESARAIDPAIMVLAVTVLTSMEEKDLGGLGVAGSLVDQVLRLGTMAIECGCQGIVASAHEARALRSELGEEFAIITPGVRPAGGDKGDQARVVTPRQAMAAGATHIVVGRPIVAAADPASAAREILSQMVD